VGAQQKNIGGVGASVHPQSRCPCLCCNISRNL